MMHSTWLSIFFSASLMAALPTQQEALNRAFPGQQTLRRECTLSSSQAAKVKALSGSELNSLWLVVYEARREGKVTGVAYFDTHLVRTQNETAMVVVGSDGRLLRVEVISFREPMEYLPKEGWVHQFDGKKLDDDLSLKKSIHPLSGATLTARALTDASRRCLALHQVLYGAP